MGRNFGDGEVMWLYSKDFFCSVVRAKQRDRYQVRFRTKIHLDGFLNKYGGKPIITPKADYLYRVMIDKQKLVEVMIDVAEHIDYPNFKNKVHKMRADPDETIAMMSIWEAMYELQLNKQGRTMKHGWFPVSESR